MNGLRPFVFNGVLTTQRLQELTSSGIDVSGDDRVARDRVFDQQDFSPKIVHAAGKMAHVYELLYCIENSARSLIIDRLSEAHGANWWELAIPSKIQTKVDNLQKGEASRRYHTQRSSNQIGYTTFGQLSDIIITCWDEFADLLPNQHWIQSRFEDMEISRNIVMHTGELPDQEVARIRQIAKDWVQQVG